MKVSIITVSYNSATTISDTIESVLGQDYTDFEHIIIDGGSTDDTIGVIGRYEPAYNGRLKMISEPDSGIYDGMNKGLRMATGDIIGFLNSDDFFNSNHVLHKICKGIKDVDAVYGDLVYVDKQNKDKTVRIWKGSQYYKGAFMHGWHPAHPTFYARRQCYERWGIHDTTFEVSADFELMLRFFEIGRITNRYLPYTLVKMRIGGESTGSLSNIIKGNKNVLKAFKKNGIKVPRFYVFKRLLPKIKSVIAAKLK